MLNVTFLQSMNYMNTNTSRNPVDAQRSLEHGTSKPEHLSVYHILEHIALVLGYWYYYGPIPNSRINISNYPKLNARKFTI